MDDARRVPKISKGTKLILSSLASSVLPVIVSGPLWTLTTSLDGRMTDTYTKSPSLFHSHSIVRRAGDSGLCSNGLGVSPSATIMNGNAGVICSLMGFICGFSKALGNDMRVHLAIILFPLLERASPVGNHSYVQRAAIKSLEQISISTGFSDIFSLISHNFDYLLDLISLRLRKHAKERIPIARSLVGVVEVILQSVALCEKVNTGLEIDEDADIPLAFTSSHVAMVGHMLNCLLSASYWQNDDKASSLDMVRVFRSINAFMDSSIAIQISSSIAPRFKVLEEGEDNKEDWLRRLDFALDMRSAGFTEGGSDEEEPFIEESPNDVNDGEPACDGANAPNDEEDASFAHEIGAINCILSRCCYLLCNADLQIQVMCCDTILSGFQSLGKVGAFRKVRPFNCMQI